MIKKIFFDITNHCNADCLHCFTLSNSYNEEPELSNDLISKILSSLNDYGLSSVSIGGGEPLTRNLFDILGNKTFETQFSITTNGTILDDKLLDVLIKNRFKITVSLDSLSQSTTSKIRKGIKTSHVLNNISKLTKIPILHENLAIRTTVSTVNTTEIIDIIDYCDSMNIKTLKLNTTNSFGRAKSNNHLIPDFKTFNQIMSLAQNYCTANNKHVKLVLPIKKHLDSKSNCQLGNNSLYINQHGDIYPCAFSERRLKLGNFFSLNKEEFLQLSTSFTHHNQVCSNCLINRYK